MLPVVVIIVILQFGSCIGEGTKGSVLNSNKSCDERDDNFFVKIEEHFPRGQPQINRYTKDVNYTIIDSNTLDITCRQMKKKKSLTLQWKDNYGFETGYHEDYEEAGLQLKIKLDKHDAGLILTCRAFEPCGERNLSITLVAYPMASKFKSETRIDHQVYLQKDEVLRNNDTCNRTVQLGYANPEHSTVPYFTNETVTFKFKESDNGTTVSCITYLDLGKTGINGNFRTVQKQIYERRKNTTVYYLKHNSGLSTQNENTETGTQRIAETLNGRETENSSGAKRKSEQGSRVAVAIVGGILGAIILILISVILVMWYKKYHRDAPDDAADEDIYAEIEERPPQLPPPRQAEPPYSTIQDTLVQKQQPIYVDQPLYSQITTE